MQITNKMRAQKKLNRDQIQPVIIVLTLAAACLAFSFVNKNFLKASNLHSILLTAVPVGLIAIGECACIMAGYFDMSVGMVAALGGLSAAFIIKSTGSLILCLLGGLGVGLVAGLLAGACVAYLNMNAFITTFALQSVYRGIIYIFTEGFPISMFGEDYLAFTRWGQLKVVGKVQFPIVALIVVYVLVALFLKYRKMGRCIYLVGSNPKCAHICGINVHCVQLFIFLLCDVLAAIAGMLYASRVASAQPFMGCLLYTSGDAPRPGAESH